MPHRLENEIEIHGVIARILVILETSIPVSSRPPLDTLPEYSDNTSSSINTNTPTTVISADIPTAITAIPEASTSTLATDNDTPATTNSSSKRPTDQLSSVGGINPIDHTPTDDDGNDDLACHPASSNLLPQNPFPASQLTVDEAPLHPLSESSSPQIHKVEEEAQVLQSPKYSPSPSSSITSPPPSSSPQSGEKTTLPPSPHTPRDDHLFHTRVLVIYAALGVAIVWAVLRSRQ